MRLLSSDINWESGATWAIVDMESNAVEEQIDFDPSLNVESFTRVGAFGYGGVFHYQVKRASIEDEANLKAQIEKDLREQDNGLAQGTLTPIPLKQIKPVVIGYQRVFIDTGKRRSPCIISKADMEWQAKSESLWGVEQPRFRPVYDYGVKS